jgi:hypothetical protein
MSGWEDSIRTFAAVPMTISPTYMAPPMMTAQVTLLRAALMSCAVKKRTTV